MAVPCRSSRATSMRKEATRSIRWKVNRIFRVGFAAPLAFSVDADAILSSAETRTESGQPRYSALAITTALTLRAVFRLALRQTEGLIASILRLLGLDLAAPDHSTISRRGETLPVSRPRPGSDPVPPQQQQGMNLIPGKVKLSTGCQP